MNEKIIKPFLFHLWPIVLTGLFLLAGCQADLLQYDDPLYEDSSPLGQAKSWYRDARGRTEVLLSTPGTRSGESPLFFTEPSWQYYAVSQQGECTAVEVDLTDRIGLDFVTEEQQRAYEATGDWKYRRSYTRLVILSNNATGEKTGFLMTLIPSAWTIRFFNENIAKTTYFHRDRFFVGLIVFHDLDGHFVNGWSYRQGKLYGTVVQVPDLSGTNVRGAVYSASYTIAPPVQTRNGWESDYVYGGELDAAVCNGTPSMSDREWQLLLDYYWYVQPVNEPQYGGEYSGDNYYSGGGGRTSTGNGNTETTPPRKEKVDEKDCSESAIQNSSQAKAHWEALKKAGIDDFIAEYKDKDVEYAQALYRDLNGNYQLSDVQTCHLADRVKIRYSSTTVCAIHNHPSCNSRKRRLKPVPTTA